MDDGPPEPALKVFVTDAETRENLAGGATGSVKDGSFSADLEPVPDPYAGAVTALGFTTRTNGLYEVMIAHPGYETWEGTAAVDVNPPCYFGAQQTIVEAELVPLVL